jgi:hypothetical protein
VFAQVNLQHSFKMNEETLGISEKVGSTTCKPPIDRRSSLSHTFRAHVHAQESEDLRGMFVHTVRHRECGSDYGAASSRGFRCTDPVLARALPQNPVLLYTTVGISALHLLFDVLAFKNDVRR